MPPHEPFLILECGGTTPRLTTSLGSPHEHGTGPPGIACERGVPSRLRVESGAEAPHSILSCVIVALYSVLACLMFGGCGRESEAASDAAGAARAPRLNIEYHPTPIGAPASEFGRPMVTHVKIVDLDRDDLPDVLYCEGRKNSVRWIRQSPRGVFTEHVIDDAARHDARPTRRTAAPRASSGRSSSSRSASSATTSR